MSRGAEAGPLHLTSLKEFLDAVRDGRNVINLSLVGSNIGADEAIALAAALKKNATLTTLSLVCSNIGADEAIALAAALKENATLTALNLVNNRIGDAGAIALAAAVKENATLKTLYLMRNRIGDAGATALAAAVKENATLTTLDLGNNRIGDAGATAFAATVKENATLKTLYLMDNRIGGAGNTALAAALEVNGTVTEMGFIIPIEQNNPITEAVNRNTHAQAIAKKFSDAMIAMISGDPAKKILTAKDAAFLSDPAHPGNSLKVLQHFEKNLAALGREESHDFYLQSHDFEFVKIIAAAAVADPMFEGCALRRVKIFKSGTKPFAFEGNNLPHAGEVLKELCDLPWEQQFKILETFGVKDAAKIAEAIRDSRMREDHKDRKAAGTGGGGGGGGGGSGEEIPASIVAEADAAAAAAARVTERSRGI